MSGAATTTGVHRISSQHHAQVIGGEEGLCFPLEESVTCRQERVHVHYALVPKQQQQTNKHNKQNKKEGKIITSA
jgi:hypothetical protein